MEHNPQFPLKCLTEYTKDDVRPMNPQTTKLFSGIFLSEMNALGLEMHKYMLWDKSPPEQNDKAATAMLIQSVSAQVLFERLAKEAPDMLLTTHLFVWLALDCDRPAKSVMWAHALFELWLALPIEEPLTLKFWAERFPIGLPSDIFYKHCWMSQKDRNAERDQNVLDQPEFWEWMRSRRKKNNPGTKSS